MTDEVCMYGRCDGGGWVVTDDMNSVLCLCLKRKMARQSMGEEIWTDGGKLKVAETPLYKPGGIDNPPEIDRTGENLFLRGSYFNLAAHLRRSLGSKLIDTECAFRVQVVTDERLKNVFVGAESYDKRSKKDRDYITTMNSLRDLIGSEYDLVVIRLGFLGHSNKAAPGLLKEALMLRTGMSKPTWIAENTEVEFGASYPAWSADVAYYIEQRFETVDLEAFDGTIPEPEAGVADVDLDSPPERSLPRVRRVNPEPEVESPSVSLPGAFGGKQDKPGKKPGKGPMG